MMKMGEHVDARMMLNVGLHARPSLEEIIPVPFFSAKVICRDFRGYIRWEDGYDHNLVVTVGRNDMLDKYFKGSAYTAAFYLGLKGTGSAAAGDTLASHAGWAEVNPYTGNRPAITFGTSSGGSNTATGITYTITTAGPTTVAGAFVATVNTGTAGILYSAGDFSAARQVYVNDTLTVTLTVSV